MAVSFTLNSLTCNFNIERIKQQKRDLLRMEAERVHNLLDSRVQDQLDQLEKPKREHAKTIRKMLIIPELFVK